VRRESLAVDARAEDLGFRSASNSDWRTHRPERRAQAASERRIGHGAAYCSGACEAGSGGGRARTPSGGTLGAASRAITQLGGGFTAKPALRPNGKRIY